MGKNGGSNGKSDTGGGGEHKERRERWWWWGGGEVSAAIWSELIPVSVPHLSGKVPVSGTYIGCIDTRGNKARTASASPALSLELPRFPSLAPSLTLH